MPTAIAEMAAVPIESRIPVQPIRPRLTSAAVASGNSTRKPPASERKRINVITTTRIEIWIRLMVLPWTMVSLSAMALVTPPPTRAVTGRPANRRSASACVATVMAFMARKSSVFRYAVMTACWNGRSTKCKLIVRDDGDDLLVVGVRHDAGGGRGEAIRTFGDDDAHGNDSGTTARRREQGADADGPVGRIHAGADK